MLGLWAINMPVALAEEKVIYKYKTYEKFDLGNLEIKGEIIAPGDLSVGERSRKVFDSQLLDRVDLRDFIARDHRLLR